MGCEVVVEGASARDLERIRALFEKRDAVFSRFRADSELSRVNATDGATLVSPLFARMLETALRARDRRGGLVTPTLADVLEAAGYDRDFEELEPSGEPPRAAEPAEVRCSGACSSSGAGST